MKKYIKILLIIYVISIIGARYVIKWHYENKWKSINPGFGEMVLTFIPVINTAICIVWPIATLFDKDDVSNKFFDIKKR